MNYYLGLEIGGTKLQAGVGDGHRPQAVMERVPAAIAGGRESILAQLPELADRALAKANLTRSQITAVAIGFGGPVDVERRRTITSHQVPGWDDFPLGQWAEETLGRPAIVANDSDLAGLAEATWGAGRDHDPVLYMNIGSGIGGSLIINQSIYQGRGRATTEIGHLRVLPADNLNKPWKTLEELCSGWALAEAARNAALRQPKSRLVTLAEGKITAIDTSILVEAVRQGDDTALRIWGSAVIILGAAIANCMTLLDPAILVLGGGVSLAGEILLGPLRQTLAKQVMVAQGGLCPVVVAELGENVVVQGALCWAARQQGRSV